MAVQALHLEGFRNLQSVVFRPGPHLNVIYGDNGQGKTSVLEAVYYLANLKSFRTSRQEDLIQAGQSEARLVANLEQSGSRHRLEIRMSSSGREKWLNGKVPRNNGDIYALLRPILFAPEHVSLVSGSPGPRRDMLDRAIFTGDPAYVGLVLEYGRVLRQRNRLLKEEKWSLLEPWTQALIDHGARIRQHRNDYVNLLKPFFLQSYDEIAQKKEGADLVVGEAKTYENLQQDLKDQLSRQVNQERRMGTSLAGPHRDDVSFILGEKPARSYASQGQQRSLILAFKMAQTRLLEEQTGQRPLVLLDDMTSELDSAREQQLIRFLQDSGGQVVITTTDHRQYQSIDATAVQFFRMEQGVLFSE